MSKGVSRLDVSQQDLVATQPNPATQKRYDCVRCLENLEGDLNHLLSNWCYFVCEPLL